MYHTVFRLTGNRSDAQDVVQEGFVKIFKEMRRFRGDSGLYAWMKRIMINETIDFLRKKKKVSALNEDLPEVVEMPALAVAKNTSPELVARIHDAIRQLPNGSKQVMSMFLFEGMTHKEIAQVLSISESTSKSQYHRAKQLVRNYINTKNQL